jgi:hypothetical protein
MEKWNICTSCKDRDTAIVLSSMLEESGFECDSKIDYSILNYGVGICFKELETHNRRKYELYHYTFIEEHVDIILTNDEFLELTPDNLDDKVHFYLTTFKLGLL